MSAITGLALENLRGGIHSSPICTRNRVKEHVCSLSEKSGVTVMKKKEKTDEGVAFTNAIEKRFRYYAVNTYQSVHKSSGMLK